MHYINLPKAHDQSAVSRHTENWLRKAKSHDSQSLNNFCETMAYDNKYSSLLKCIFGNSPYLSKILIDNIFLFQKIIESGLISTYQDICTDLRKQIKQELSFIKFSKILRIAKKKISLLIAIADITQEWSLEKVMIKWSEFADLCLQISLEYLCQTSQYVDFTDYTKKPVNKGIIVLALGKLGGFELNYSSDIDIIILYDAEYYFSQQASERQHLVLQNKIVKLTHLLVKLLHERTIDGYVFRTDLRLRPDPSSMPLAMSTQRALEYYFKVGQNWERAAMIKARICAGNKRRGRLFLKQLTPYIWREYLDFWAIKDTHAMKRQITLHHKLQDLKMPGHNIKLGRGGIREIEFFIQTEQLIWGGKNSKLRSRKTCQALMKCAKYKIIPFHKATKLKASYRFLRILEHRLQMIDDMQTHTLPLTDDKLLHLATFLGYEHLEQFEQDLIYHLKTVEEDYAGLFEEKYPLSYSGNLVFTGIENDPDTTKTLLNMGFLQPQTIQSTIRVWHHGRYEATQTVRSRQILTEFIPVLLEEMSKTARPDLAFVNFDKFIQKFKNGAYFFAVLNANPNHLQVLMQIMGSAPRLAQHLTQHIEMFDSLIEDDKKISLTTLDDYIKDLESNLYKITNLPDQIHAIGKWKREQKFLVGTKFLQAQIGPFKASRAYSYIAEAVICTMQSLIEKDFEKTHGLLYNSASGQFLILAYGKLGAKEMTPTSDLDLVLVIPEISSNTMSSGAIPLTPDQYYAKLCKKFITAFSESTSDINIYNIDMRLRPFGDSGPLLSKFSSYILYQEKSAWTWEHMALTKMRIITGPPQLCVLLKQNITDILSKKRAQDKIIDDIVDMRKKIHTHHQITKDVVQKLWKIKYISGGLLDLEFIVEYYGLVYSYQNKDLLTSSTRRAIKKLFRQGLISENHYNILIDAHKLWLSIQIFTRLTLDDHFYKDDLPEELKKSMCKITNSLDFETLEKKMKYYIEHVRTLYSQTFLKGR